MAPFNRSITAIFLVGTAIVLTYNLSALHGKAFLDEGPRLTTRSFTGGWADFTRHALANQFINPQGITAVLLLIGGDVISKAIAQLSGTYENRGLVPVLFSYGWVSYAFTQLSNAVGNGAYFPAPDYPGTIISLTSGDKRDIRSWVLARLLRDRERIIDPDGLIARRIPPKDTALHVHVYQVNTPQNVDKVKARRDGWWWSFILPLTLQLIVASIPIMPTPKRSEPNFYILFITIWGTLLSFLTGSFQASRMEKYGLRGGSAAELGSRDMFALTKGNGHNIVVVILPDTFDKSRRQDSNAWVSDSKLPYLDNIATASFRPDSASRFLAGFWALLWVILLLVIGGSQADSWYLLAVGFVGMVHTLLVASAPREPDAHGIPLRDLGEDWVVKGSTVMDALIQLEEMIPGAGHMLRTEFFNGPQKPSDKEAWDHFTREEGLGEQEAKTLWERQMRHMTRDQIFDITKATRWLNAGEKQQLCRKDARGLTARQVKDLLRIRVEKQEREQRKHLVLKLIKRLTRQQQEAMASRLARITEREKQDGQRLKEWLRTEVRLLDARKLRDLALSQIRGLTATEINSVPGYKDMTWDERMMRLIEKRRDNWKRDTFLRLRGDGNPEDALIPVHPENDTDSESTSSEESFHSAEGMGAEEQDRN